MPFSSLSDPADIARAHAALDRAWRELEARGIVDPQRTKAQYNRLAAYIAGYAVMVGDEDELVKRVVQRFVERG